TAYEITRRDWSSDVCSSDLLTVTGLASLTASGAAITLTSANDFQGALTAVGTTIQLNDINALTFGAGTTSANALSVSSGAGPIANAPSAAVNVSGNASFSGASINLGSQSGDTLNFGTLTFSAPGSVSIA